MNKKHCVLPRKLENGCKPTMALSFLAASLETENQKFVSNVWDIFVQEAEKQNTYISF